VRAVAKHENDKQAEKRMNAGQTENLSVKFESNVPAEMRDGSVLKADIYRPTQRGHYPVLLCRTPYDKQREEYVETAYALAARGYIAVVQDIRGRGASDGEFIWSFGDNSKTSDGEDGYDSVGWAASLPGSDGQVGTWGHSYPAWVTWRLAAENPPHLKAIFPSGISARLLDLNFGIFETGRRLQWTHMMAADARSRAGDKTGPRTRQEAEYNWQEVYRGKWIWFLPLEDIPDYVFSTLTPMLKRYYREQDQEFWAFDEIHHRVNVPACHVTGWYDRLIGTIDNFTGMVNNGSESVREQHRLIIGPWPHNDTRWTRRQGPLDFGPEADAKLAHLLARWYDHHFKGRDTGIGSEPPIKLFVMGENRWRFENEWPLARTQYTEFFLHSGGRANSTLGDGFLTTSEPGHQSPDEFDYDPRDPVMSLMSPDAQATACDQSPLDGRRDILVYQSQPLTEEIEITGPVVLKLWASSSAPDTDFTAKLIDVHPNGLAVNLCYGIIRARYRDGYANPSLIQPYLPYEYTIRLTPTSVLFQRGHRIRLDVSSSDFPNFDRNHNTGKDFWSDIEMLLAHQTVFHDREHPSRLILPMIPR
jgi:putative CocE/NonD family hydrolase